MLLAAVFAVAAATSVNFPVSTTKPPAQAAMNRGLFLYYAYDREAAAQAFAQAADLDPRLAMAYWGVALADGPDLNTPLTQERFTQAKSAIAKAQSVDAALPARERRFIEMMALRYRGDFSRWNADDAAYLSAMAGFADTSHDQNAELLAAEALLERGGLAWHDGALESADSQRALALVENVLHVDPASAMANHLCIHLYDLAPSRDPALPCAQRLDAAEFPPEAEHLAHMPAHYWIENGDYAAAVRSSERAVTLLTQLTQTDPPDDAHVDQYAKHDVAVGYCAAMMLGDYALARRWAARMTSQFGVGFDALTALRFGRYQSAYDAPADEFGDPAVRGLAALQLGRIDNAQTIAKQVTPQAASHGYVPQLFLASLAKAQGRYDDAQSWLEKAAAAQHAGFEAELIPFFPALEALGALRLRHGDFGGAAQAFEADLSAYPNDPRALFGLAQALRALGDASRAAATQAHFQKVWQGADTSLVDTLP